MAKNKKELILVRGKVISITQHSTCDAVKLDYINNTEIYFYTGKNKLKEGQEIEVKGEIIETWEATSRRKEQHRIKVKELTA